MWRKSSEVEGNEAERNDQPYRRVQFDFSRDAYEDLIDLKSSLGLKTMADAVRYALQTLRWVMTQSAAGHAILVEKGGGQTREVVFPFLSPRPQEPIREAREAMDAEGTPPQTAQQDTQQTDRAATAFRSVSAEQEAEYRQKGKEFRERFKREARSTTHGDPRRREEPETR
jgi:hypothetical protein